MNISKSIDFLLDKGGDVTKYRLHKEILHDLSEAEEDALLEKVLQTPHYKLVEKYRKPNGYIGIGMHSWDKFKETPLQDGEAAARLLSNYGIPKDSAIIKDFIAAMRNDAVLQEEFSYYHPEITRFENRFLGLKNGGGLMVLIYTCQALLGCDDEYMKDFIDISYNAFCKILEISSLDDITIYKPQLKRKNNCPYIESETYFPCQYHLETLAHTASWRNDESVEMISRTINHLNSIMKDDNQLAIKIGTNYYGPLYAFATPTKPFTLQAPFGLALRKTITHLAMVGGSRIDVVRQSADAVAEAMEDDGILRISFESAYQKSRYKEGLKYPTPYSEIALETSHRTDTQIWCELTFWAVQLLYILGLAEI